MQSSKEGRKTYLMLENTYYKVRFFAHRCICYGSNIRNPEWPRSELLIKYHALLLIYYVTQKTREAAGLKEIKT
jgi:hypothetical protein